MTRRKKRRTPRCREDLLGLTGAGAADRSQQEVRGTDEHEKGLSEGARGDVSRRFRIGKTGSMKLFIPNSNKALKFLDSLSTSGTLDLTRIYVFF